MDDFILILPDKKTAKEYKFKIEEFIKKNLKLELNYKSRYYPIKQGVNFCGYRIFKDFRLLRQNNKKKINKQVNKWNKDFKDNKLDINKTLATLNSWTAHASHSDGYRISFKIINKCNFLYNFNFVKKQEEYILSLMRITFINFSF